ncbi:zinc finger protein 569-like [Ruditapes philippinarum]|uniref:zinc finger protein 569-like n=1 Tax=Ruditapes philippinarum TaxID=129788 RepID=UPI00295AB0F2|nr:zinc finger protein 569-like [Ruditapes philippinarum]XP_060600700.1 zinc finger protein 569-like [Ruditapes philippinarum]
MDTVGDGTVTVPLAQDDINVQLVNGHIYANTCNIQVSDTSQIPIQITLDSSQHNYSAPVAMEHVVIRSDDHNSDQILITDTRSLKDEMNVYNDDSDTDVNDKVMSGSSMEQHVNLKVESVSEDLIPDRLSLYQSIYHHDYIGTIPVIQRPLSITNSDHVSPQLGDHENGLVIEEAVEEEISTSQSLDEEEEIVRSKPLTAMYLQRKDIYIPTHRERRLSTPTKSPGSSKFTLKPSSSRTLDIDDLNSYDDLYRMRQAYNDPVSVYHPNTGEIHFKMEPVFDVERKSPSKRSVEAILAASETIKNQDIASEVEIGTYEVEVSPTSKRGRKKKERKGGIDDDIEQIRKAAKDVAYTLKGMNKKKDGRKRRKPRIRLTLTKSKSRQVQTVSYPDEGMEYESSSSPSPKKRGRKRKGAQESPNIIYQCEYCEKQFKTREKVRIHTKIHTEERAFGCDICGSQYRRREHLVRHYRRHTNERPYRCLECGKSYMRAEHLKRHSYDHSGEKPFECPICPRAFTRHDRLIKHSLVHDK